MTFKHYLTEITQSVLDKQAILISKNSNAPIDTIKPLLLTYNTLSTKNQLKPQHKNIQSIKTKQQLSDILSNYKDTTKSEQKKKFHIYNEKDAPIVFKNHKVTVYHILSHEMACKLGTNTDWCIAVKDNPAHWIKTYNPKYNIYYVIPTDNPEHKLAVLIDHNGDINSVWDILDEKLKIDAMERYFTFELKIPKNIWKPKLFDITDFIDEQGNLNLGDMNLFSLPKGIPDTIDGTFNCAYNHLKSLEGSPTYVKGDFICAYNGLTSLTHAPKTVRGSFSCQHNLILFTEDDVMEVSNVRGNIYT